MTNDHDLAALRERFPGWRITARWTTTASGPDARLIRAERGTLVLTATTAADLTQQIDQAGQDEQAEH